MSLSDLSSKYVRQRAALITLYDMIKSDGIYTDEQRKNAMRIIALVTDMPVETEQNEENELSSDFML